MRFWRTMPDARPEPLAPGYRERPYWWDDVDWPVPPESPLPRTADAVVIGSGYTGLGAALELTRRGRHVVVLERGALAEGASSRNGGMVHPGVKHDLHELVSTPGGRDLFEVTVEAFDGLEKLIADEGIDCAWQRSGHLYLAHLPSLVPHLRAAERAYVDGVGQEARFVPAHRLGEEIGSPAYHGGLVVEKSGGLHPARLVAGLARSVLHAGASIHERTEARRVERVSAGRMRVTTSRGAITAGRVLVATNGYTTGLVPWLHRRILPIGSYIIATEPLDPAVAADVSPQGRMFFDTKHFIYYWRLAPDGRRLLFGGRTSFAPTTVERSRRQLYAAMLRVHPQLQGVAIERAWGGQVALTFDRMPHIGERDGVTYAMGYCGTGVAMATHFGRIAGRWMAGDADAGLTPFASRRWPPVPPPARVRWLLPVGGCWYQARDRLGR
jgi:glycine/D-amino acid oxidase-like deaminating enzyme